MSRWAVKANIAHFKERLAAEKDPLRRSVLEELLAKEERKLRELGEDKEES